MQSNVPELRVSAGRHDLADMLDAAPNALTVADLARTLNLSTKTIFRQIRKRQIPGAFRIGTAVRLDQHRVAAWLREVTA